MPTYQAPVKDTLFILNDVLDIGKYSNLPGFANATPDLIEAICEEMGKFSCEHNLTRIYRIFFRFGNLGFLFDRAAKAWRSQYDFGSMTLERESKSRVHMVLSDTPRFDRASRASV